jgi:hypothetical protein
MENLFYDLSETEFSKGRKILLWIFSLLFFLAGMAVIFMNVALHDQSMHISLSLVPLGISLVVAMIAVMATFKRKGLFFLIDHEKIEFRFGLIKPVKHSFKWNDIKEICMPHKQKKVLLMLKDNSSFIINLTWLERRRTANIRKYVFYAAKENNIPVLKVQMLSRN